MKQSYDYIVVGAGSAGSIMAARLSEDPGARVLVVEAGPSDLSVFVRMPGAQIYPLLNPRRTWRFETGPEPALGGRTIMHARGRMMGGSSSLNGMVYVRGNPRDYEAWAAMGLPDWSFAHCLPYFKKLENNDRGANEYRGGDGPVRITTMPGKHPLFEAFLEAGQQAGLHLNDDYNGFRQEGVHLHQANLDHGIRASTGRAYLRPAMRRGGVRVVLNAQVTRVRFDGSRRAVGVHYVAGGTEYFAEAAREVILSGSAYKTPQLLMLSGVGDREQLAKHAITPVADVPGVGRNLQDHPCVPVGYRAKVAGISPGSRMNLIKMGWTGAQWLFARRGLGATNLWETGAFFKSRDDVDYADFQHEFVPLLGEYGQDNFSVEDGFYYSTCLMRPKSRGFVELRSADPMEQPRVVHNYLEDADDRCAMIAAVRKTDEIIQQPAWDALRGERIAPALRNASDDEIYAWLNQHVSTQYHPVGTCRMGTDDMSVVDAEGRVHGVQGLRVVDSSIIPLITSGNLNCPTMMVAEKVADSMRGRALEPQHLDYADRVA